MSSSSVVDGLFASFDEHGVALSASVKDAASAIAILLHLRTLQHTNGTKCIAISDQTTTTTSEKGLPTIPPHWSNQADGFCFQYLIPPASSATAASSATRRVLLVKSIRIDQHTLIVHACLKDANGDAGKEIYTMELNVNDHIDANAFRPEAASSSSSTSPTTTAPQQLDFHRIFKDLPALVALYDRMILDKLLPPVSSDGASKKSTSPPAASSSATRIDPRGRYPPDTQPPNRPEDDRPPEGFDPLRVYNPRGNRGPFAGDIDPLSGGPAGNLMGPGQFPFGGTGRGPLPPGMAPRFDPYGPIPGMGSPDFDELRPPGPGGPLADIGGPLAMGQPRRPGFGPGGQTGFGRGNNGLGGPYGFGGGGFGGNQFM